VVVKVTDECAEWGREEDKSALYDDNVATLIPNLSYA
jgi:hypothetical protein